jgi:hypothetical protein
VESLVFFSNGCRCPLTALARRYGGPSGHVGDTLLPERLTRYTFRLFGGIFLVGLILVSVNHLGWR